MDDAGLRDALATEARRVLDVDPAALDRPVPWDAEWTVGRVVAHLGSIHRWATALCNEPGVKLRRRDMERPPEGPAVLGWFEAGIRPLLAAFDGTDLDTIVHTWAGDQPRRWWLRRLAHETTVHRWDVDAASRGVQGVRPIDPTLAADGIDELFGNFVPLVGDQATGAGETLHVHPTDADGEWQLTFGEAGITVERVHAKADAAVRGPAMELLLLLWNRTAADSTGVEVFGDRAVLDRWRRTVSF